MFKNAVLSASIALGVAVASSAAYADTLTVGSGWSQFSFAGVGSSFSTSFTFDLTAPALFKVTDAFLDGDQFNIFINGVDMGLTSTPVNDGTNINSNYDAAFASSLFSHASYLLGPGSYTVTGTVVLSPYGAGGAAAELSAPSAVPLPGALWLFGSAMAGWIGFAGVRRKKDVAVA